MIPLFFFVDFSGLNESLSTLLSSFECFPKFFLLLWLFFDYFVDYFDLFWLILTFFDFFQLFLTSLNSFDFCRLFYFFNFFKLFFTFCQLFSLENHHSTIIRLISIKIKQTQILYQNNIHPNQNPLKQIKSNATSKSNQSNQLK